MSSDYTPVLSAEELAVAGTGPCIRCGTRCAAVENEDYSGTHTFLCDTCTAELDRVHAEKELLTYDSRDMRYHGVGSTGQPIIIDADAFAEARQQRERDGMDPDQAAEETADPDGWSEDMVGWIPAGE
jgi:hypothetical protein